MYAYFTHVLQYRKTPLMSTSLTAAFTIGRFTIAGPNPTSNKQPPDFVAWKWKTVVDSFKS